MAALSFGFTATATAIHVSPTPFRTRTRTRPNPNTITCVGWDPEGLFGKPQTGHIARREFQRRLEKDADAREAVERHLREEKERRQAVRESRIVPKNETALIEYFLDTEAQDIEYEIARLRPRLTEEFFSSIKLELGEIRFAVNKTEDMEDRVIELEALQKALEEGIEAYDKMQGELVKARESLAKIFSSKDVKATLLEMVERNELNRSLLALLDENIANAQTGNQKDAAAFMEKVRGAVLKYMTV